MSRDIPEAYGWGKILGMLCNELYPCSTIIVAINAGELLTA